MVTNFAGPKSNFAFLYKMIYKLRCIEKTGGVWGVLHVGFCPAKKYFRLASMLLSTAGQWSALEV